MPTIDVIPVGMMDTAFVAQSEVDRFQYWKRLSQLFTQPVHTPLDFTSSRIDREEKVQQRVAELKKTAPSLALFSIER